jgi:hypothetical protein
MRLTRSWVGLRDADIGPDLEPGAAGELHCPADVGEDLVVGEAPHHLRVDLGLVPVEAHVDRVHPGIDQLEDIRSVSTAPFDEKAVVASSDTCFTNL